MSHTVSRLIISAGKIKLAAEIFDPRDEMGNKVNFLSRQWVLNKSAYLRSRSVSAISLVRKIFVNIWFFVFAICTISSYLLLLYTAEKVHGLPTVSVAIYSHLDKSLAPKLAISDEQVAIEIPWDGNRPFDDEVNIFISGVNLEQCTDYQRGKSIDPVPVKGFFISPTMTQPLFRIITEQQSAVHCKTHNIPSSISYSERAIDILLSTIGYNANGIFDQSVVDKMGEPASDLEVGFPFMDVSDFSIIFGGLPSQYVDPTLSELVSNERKNPLLMLGPTKSRLTLSGVPRVEARWNSPDARDRRDMLFLIVGVILGIGGAALIEWVKTLIPEHGKPESGF